MMSVQCQAIDDIWSDPLAKRRNQRGASLIESLAFLGTATVVSVNSLALVNTAFSDVGSVGILQETALIQTAVRQLYQGQSGSYGGLDNAVLVAAKLLPATLHVNSDNSAATDQWGGDVDVAVMPDNPALFEIAYADVPQAVCVDALTAATANWTAVGVAGGSGYFAPADVTPDVATGQCATGQNTVVWLSN